VDGVTAFITHSTPQYIGRGRFMATCHIPANYLNDDVYTITVMGVADRSTALIECKNVLTIEGIEPPRVGGWMGKNPGVVRPKFNWNIQTLNRAGEHGF
jgi:lipopolysaccharide transport system ATP-binding protein